MKQPSLRRVSSFVAAATCALAVTACSSDDSNPIQPSAPNTSTAFSSTLDRAQTTNAATLGAAVRVTIRNQAPSLGTYQTPVWVGFHDGSFELYDAGSAASAELERLAEDGDVGPLGTAFTTAAVGAAAGTIGGVLGPVDGPVNPGESASRTFRLSPSDANARYLSWASMVIPSNDAFIANDDPVAHEVFDGSGAFVGGSFTILGTDVLDAGTEVNDEVPANTAFFGQAAPNTGTSEGSTVGNHVGFLAPGMGGILDDMMFSGADFEMTPGYEVLEVAVEDATAGIAEPSGFAFVTVDEMTMMLTVDVSVSGLSGPATLFHLHQAAQGAAGPVIVDLASLIVVNEGGVMTAQGQAAVTASQLTAMRNGNVYFNVHTDLNTNGEVRGQVRANNASFASLDAASPVTPPVTGSNLRVTAQNTAPDLGTYQTPLWVALHDGTFDLYDLGSAASAELERIAEDGNAGPLGDALELSGAGSIRGLVAGAAGPIEPGETASALFRVDASAMTNRYLSWATMILPSNDAFLANDGPMAHEIFGIGGAFSGMGFTAVAADALDAGTEVNDEAPANTAFFGQSAPNTGTMEVGTVGMHPGFLAMGMGGILDSAMFMNADFATTPGYEFLNVAVAELAVTTPAPSGVTTVRVSGSTATFSVGCVNLSGPATSVTIRNAATGVDGPVLFDLMSGIGANSNGALDASGTFTTTMAFESALAADELYLEITTALNPTGELRGQISVAP